MLPAGSLRRVRQAGLAARNGETEDIEVAGNLRPDMGKTTMGSFFTPDVLVALAGGCFVLGYLIINQLMLRLVLMVGSFIYVAYYWTAADEPLWSAIYLSIAMICANMIGITGLFARQSRLAIPAAHKDIYHLFGDLPPGDFRDLVLRANRRTLQEDEVVSNAGQPMRKLYYVLSGTAQVEKAGERFTLPAAVLVGEVAYMRRRPSSATTTVVAGSEILEWNVDVLEARAARSSRFQLALESMISKDLAEKVALAVAPREYRLPTSAVQEAAE